MEKSKHRLPKYKEMYLAKLEFSDGLVGDRTGQKPVCGRVYEFWTE